MKLTTYTGYRRVEKSTTPTQQEIENGALVLYINGYMESIMGHIRFFLKRKDGSDEWTAGSSDDVTDMVECWFRREKHQEDEEIEQLREHMNLAQWASKNGWEYFGGPTHKWRKGTADGNFDDYEYKTSSELLEMYKEYKNGKNHENEG